MDKELLRKDIIKYLFFYNMEGLTEKSFMYKVDRVVLREVIFSINSSRLFSPILISYDVNGLLCFNVS